MARLFQNEIIYLPCFLDFRGRVYPLVNYLSHQSGDIARSYFHNTRFNGDLNYLYIYLADVYGIKKKTRLARIKWIENNLDLMLTLYTENRNEFNDKYLTKAKEKAQFMACIQLITNENKGLGHRVV